jgi:hypothetical protein
MHGGTGYLLALLGGALVTGEELRATQVRCHMWAGLASSGGGRGREGGQGGRGDD